MHVVADVALVCAGVLAVFVVLDAALRTFVLPRGAPRAVHARRVPLRAPDCCSVFARPNRSYEARDRVMALYAPLALLDVPGGRARGDLRRVRLLLRGGRSRTAGATRCSRAARRCSRSGSTGRAGSARRSSRSPRPRSGSALLAVLIAYLPTIYGSFSRREVMVTQLSVRAGTPPTAWRMLELAHRAGYLNNLDPVWNEWMQWFSELSETHTSLGALAFFRSPNPNRSWITAAGTVLDAAALRLAVLNIPFTPEPGSVHPLGVPRAAGDRRLLRLRPRSRPGARRSDQRRPRGVHGDLRAAGGRRACRSAPTASGPGATSRAGGSTTTGCCWRCAAW